MAATTSKLIELVRGIAVDQSDSGLQLLFSDAEVIDALNYAKHDLFGRRPDAFCVSAVRTTEPDDLVSASACLDFTYGETSAIIQNLDTLVGATLAAGSLSIDIRTATADGTILYIGTGETDYLRLFIESGLPKVRIYQTVVGNVTVALTGEINTGSWESLTVTLASNVLTLEDGYGNQVTGAWTGNFLPGTQNAYLGFSSIGGTDQYFGGSMLDLTIENGAGTQLAGFGMDDGSGAKLSEDVTSAAYNAAVMVGSGEAAALALKLAAEADIFDSGDDITWLDDDLLDVASWAQSPLCYMAASVLMSQKSKDAYYRKASDEALKKYLGAI